MVSNPLKNISQLGLFFPIYGKTTCSKPPTRYVHPPKMDPRYRLAKLGCQEFVWWPATVTQWMGVSWNGIPKWMFYGENKWTLMIWGYPHIIYDVQSIQKQHTWCYLTNLWSLPNLTHLDSIWPHWKVSLAISSLFELLMVSAYLSSHSLDPRHNRWNFCLSPGGTVCSKPRASDCTRGNSETYSRGSSSESQNLQSLFDPIGSNMIQSSRFM